jgi:prophage regulatory protein
VTYERSPSPGISFVRKPALRRRTGLSDSQRDLLEAKGDFPQRVPLSERAVGWVEAEIDEWCATRVAARDSRHVTSYDQSLPARIHRRERRSVTANSTA